MVTASYLSLAHGMKKAKFALPTVLPLCSAAISSLGQSRQGRAINKKISLQLGQLESRILNTYITYKKDPSFVFLQEVPLGDLASKNY
jgi:hypothetical protein